MKTPEEIKKGLECCCTDEIGKIGRHDGCPYIMELGDCLPMLLKDALALIRQLEAENAELKKEKDRLELDITIREIHKNALIRSGEQLEKERDAAVNELKLGYACFACIYFFRNGGTCKGGSTCMERSESCSVFGAEYSGLYFKWRGPCEENGGK